MPNPQVFHVTQKIVEEHHLYSAIADEIINEDISLLIKKNQKTPALKSRSNTKIIFLTLAVFLIGSIVLTYILNKETKGEKIYAALYSSPMDSTVRGENQTAAEELKPCYLGHFQLESGDVLAAKKSFQTSVNDDDLMCQEKALYYLGLISVKENDFIKAQEFLLKVKEGEDGGYEVKADFLLQKII